MQEFGKKIGWARSGLLVSAVLLAITGVLYLAGHALPEGFLPEALHNPQLPEGYTWSAGEWIIIASMAVAGVCQLAAFNMAGGSKNLGGWLIISGIMALVWAVSALVDPFLGTFSFEWVDAVYLAFVGLAVVLAAIASGRTLGYKGWVIEVLLGLVMVALALGVVLNSANAHMMCGLGFIVYAVIVALPVLLGGNVKLKA